MLSNVARKQIAVLGDGRARLSETADLRVEWRPRQILDIVFKATEIQRHSRCPGLVRSRKRVLVDTTEVAIIGTDFVPDQATSAQLIAAIRLLIADFDGRPTTRVIGTGGRSFVEIYLNGVTAVFSKVDRIHLGRMPAHLAARLYGACFLA
jgi:hypothetical protein